MSLTKISMSKTYIAQIDRSAKPETFGDHVEWDAFVIQSIALEDNDIIDTMRIMYNYQTAFHGVAARLLLSILIGCNGENKLLGHSQNI